MPAYGSNVGMSRHQNVYNLDQFQQQVPTVPAVRRNTEERDDVRVHRLMEKYQIIWQGHLCLKNDSATVQLHYIYGSANMAERFEFYQNF